MKKIITIMCLCIVMLSTSLFAQYHDGVCFGCDSSHIQDPSTVLDLYWHNTPKGLGIPEANPALVINPKEGDFVYWPYNFAEGCMYHGFSSYWIPTGQWYMLCLRKDSIVVTPPSGPQPSTAHFCPDTINNVQTLPAWSVIRSYYIDTLYDTTSRLMFSRVMIELMNSVAPRSHPELLITNQYSYAQQENFSVVRWFDIARRDSFGFTPMSFVLFYQKILQDYGIESFAVTLSDSMGQAIHPAVIVYANNDYYLFDVVGRMCFQKLSGGLISIHQAINFLKQGSNDSLEVQGLNHESECTFLSIDSCVFFSEACYGFPTLTRNIDVEYDVALRRYRQIASTKVSYYLDYMAPVFHRITNRYHYAGVVPATNSQEIASQLHLCITDVKNGSLGSSGANLKSLIDSWVH